MSHCFITKILIQFLGQKSSAGGEVWSSLIHEQIFRGVFSNGSVQRYFARFSTIGLIRWIPPKEGDVFAGISFEHQTKKTILFSVKLVKKVNKNNEF